MQPNRQAPAVPRNGRGPYDCSIFILYSRRCPPNRGHGGDLSAVSSRCGCLRGGDTTDSTRVYKEVALSQNERGGTKLIAGWIQRVAQTKLGVETRPTCSQRRPGGEGAVDLAGAEASCRRRRCRRDYCRWMRVLQEQRWHICSWLLAAGRREAPPSGRRGTAGREARSSLPYKVGHVVRLPWVQFTSSRPSSRLGSFALFFLLFFNVFPKDCCFLYVLKLVLGLFC
jgi:hypothetical protein